MGFHEFRRSFPVLFLEQDVATNLLFNQIGVAREVLEWGLEAEVRQTRGGTHLAETDVPNILELQEAIAKAAAKSGKPRGRATTKLPREIPRRST